MGTFSIFVINKVVINQIKINWL
ncbi:erythromycin resistance leader peptide [Staphylococcus aureus]|nr:erythromycin resistance leader peptide [Staphylococcus aureus]EJO9725019.1 erythromycin resistance leader peptide [Staphylococcus aureus]EJO9879530.1 erythromycin resistance leader peptide [Staphylococcus aureus]EJO9879707.1 erythromycin resistance leader peptide [Staphylococcus aureus]EJP1012229.1 erythromycin resistance leader peptide [Staphylococcus aureus]